METHIAHHPKKLMNKKTIILLSFLFTLLLTPASLTAAEINLDHTQLLRSAEISTALSVISVKPSTGSATTVEASGTWRSGCIPEFESAEVTYMGAGSGLVQIMAKAEPAGATCGQSETDWRFPVDIQFEHPGYYTIELSVVSEQLDTTEVYAWQDVLVDGHVSFVPQAPQPEEAVTLTITGLHGDGCIPEYASSEVRDATVVVELMTPDPAESVCGQAITPWSIDVDISAPAAGDYTIEVYTSDQYEGVATDRELYATDTLSVGVRAAHVVDYFIYLPGVVLE